MSLRLIEIMMPDEAAFKLSEISDDESLIYFSAGKSADGHMLIRVLITVENSEKFLDDMESRFSRFERFRAVILPVEATVPRYEEKTDESAELTESTAEKKEQRSVMRISREELYSDLSDGTKFSKVYVAMVILSTVVAAVGLMRDNVAVIIGAMVIAPLLAPNVGLSLATTLADFKLGYQAFKTNILGILTASGFSAVLGLILSVSNETREISARTVVHLSDIVLALASGCAGALAFTSGISTALIGVMVAVALLPPLITAGLLFGSGAFSPAGGAFLLFLTNLICINLSGVLTFLLLGIRPRQWWEAGKARKATRRAISIWTVLLIILAVAIYISSRR